MRSYCVVQAMNLEDLVRQVNVLLKEHWKPQGGMAVSSNIVFYQGMVKEKLEE